MTLPRKFDPPLVFFFPEYRRLGDPLAAKPTLPPPEQVY